MKVSKVFQRFKCIRECDLRGVALNIYNDIGVGVDSRLNHQLQRTYPGSVSGSCSLGCPRGMYSSNRKIVVQWN